MLPCLIDIALKKKTEANGFFFHDIKLVFYLIYKFYKFRIFFRLSFTVFMY